MSEQRWNLKRPLAEFLAIFAGVTLSLLADDWRDTRNDARDEVAALELIHADLVRDTAEFALGALATLSLSVAERALDANEGLRQRIERELALELRREAR